MRCVALPAVAATALLILALSGPELARAEMGPIRLLSKSSTEQAEFAEAPAISADGRFVAFRGEIGGLRGVFREDVQTGAIVPVAAANAYEQGPPTEAEAPSISADGRYVSLTTPAPLDPADDGEGSTDSDVYVADMSTAPPTYELASALDGCTPGSAQSPCGLSYADDRGAIAAGRVALSADGRQVAFVTKTESDLAGPATPLGQVAVRNLETDRTILVSTERDPLTGSMTEQPVSEGAVSNGGASLSADGTTVAWLGAHLSDQVQMPSGVETGSYNEPLWRRIDDGSEAPTRRIVGAAVPRFPGIQLGGCETGPGWFSYGITSVAIERTPHLSADGNTVALLGAPDGFSNLYIVDMAADSIPRPLTRGIPIENPCQAAESGAAPNAGPITDLAVSPDAQRIAFTTQRQQFPLAPPNLVTAPPASLGAAELYLVDREAETDQRITPGHGGEASRGSSGAGSPSFTGDGRTLAFASGAFNLVAGDANAADDVFLVEDDQGHEPPGRTEISSRPSVFEAKRSWALTASAVSLPNGTVRIRAVVPAAGALSVRARASVGAKSRTRGVAASAQRAPGDGVVRVKLILRRGYRGLAAPSRGLTATALLHFRSPYGKPLRARIGVVFHARGKKHRGGSGR